MKITDEQLNYIDDALSYMRLHLIGEIEKGNHPIISWTPQNELDRLNPNYIITIKNKEI